MSTPTPPTPPRKKKYKLRDLDIDRVDLVDRGANQHAHIIINKSHTPEHPEQIGSKWDPKSLTDEVRRRRKKERKKGTAFPERMAAEVSDGYSGMSKHAQGQHDQESHGDWASGSSGKGRKVKNRPPTPKETPWIPRWKGDSDEPDEEDPGDRPTPRWKGRGENDYDDDGVSRSEADEMADRDADRYERYMRKAYPNVMDKKNPSPNPSPNAPTQVPPGSAPAPKLREDDDTKNGENPRDKLAQFMRQRAAAKEKAAPPSTPAPTPGTPAPAVAAGQAAAPASRAPGAPPGARPAMPMGGAPGAVPGQPSPPAPAPQRPQMPKTSGDLAAMMQDRRNPPQPPR